MYCWGFGSMYGFVVKINGGLVGYGMTAIYSLHAAFHAFFVHNYVHGDDV